MRDWLREPEVPVEAPCSLFRSKNHVHGKLTAIELRRYCSLTIQSGRK